jgi:hypothetical protein
MFLDWLPIIPDKLYEPPVRPVYVEGFHRQVICRRT